jgi:hypothetical protein
MEVFPCTEREFPLYGKDAKIPCIYGNNLLNTSCSFHILLLPSNEFPGYMEWFPWERGMISIGTLITRSKVPISVWRFCVMAVNMFSMFSLDHTKTIREIHYYTRMYSHRQNSAPVPDKIIMTINLMSSILKESSTYLQNLRKESI